MCACVCVRVYIHCDLSTVYWKHTFQESDQPCPVTGESFLFSDIVQTFLPNFYAFLNTDIIKYQPSIIPHNFSVHLLKNGIYLSLLFAIIQIMIK